MKQRNLRKRPICVKASRNLDTAVARGLRPGSVPRLAMPLRASSAASSGFVGKRRANETTLDMSFVHRDMKNLSPSLDGEFARQSANTTSY